MKHGTAIKAYKILHELGRTKMPAETAYKLFKLRKALQPEFDFQVEQEQKCAEIHNAVIDEKGMYRADNPEDMKAFVSDLKDLAKMDCKLEIEPVEIAVDENLKLSPDDMEALEAFVIFKF